MNAASVVETITGGGDTQTILAFEKIEFMHCQAVGMQKLQVLALMPRH